MAECHPVGFQWVMEAKARGATLIHIDPRLTRTGALADLHVPIRAGTDIALLGGLINYVLSNGLEFREYVVNYTNAATIINEEFKDTEDLDGLFSGWRDDTSSYSSDSWQYEGVRVASAAGKRQQGAKQAREAVEQRAYQRHATERGHEHGSHGAALEDLHKLRRDETLEHPRCVFQLLKRHYRRYTPEMVARICGIPEALFGQLARAVTENSNRNRTTAWAYAVGWTQHTVGVQYIRAASVLQLLLGNIGRPGGGILALRGHASIQGSTDIPTLYNLLPGYLPMPHPDSHGSLDEYVADDSAETGYWGNMRAYAVSLLKAYWGDAATADNDFCFDYLPRITGDHSTYQTVQAQLDGTCKGYFLNGQNPAVGSANARAQRLGMANLDWLVVRDFALIESATWWKDGPEIESGELRTEEIATEVFFLPAAAHTEKDGSFTNTQRMLQWHQKAVEPPGDARSDLWFWYHLGRRIRAKLAGSTNERDRPILDLNWHYSTSGPNSEPSAEEVLQEINGRRGDGSCLSTYEELTDDGSTACGCWIYCGSYAGGVNQTARRKPHTEQNWVAHEWGWAWPANRRLLYNRASADPQGRPWSERKAYVWWDAEKKKWTGHDVPDFQPTKPPDYRPPEGAKRQDALSGVDPFIMQADGKGWLYVPAGLSDGPLPTHYEPQESPVPNLLYGQQQNPARQLSRRRDVDPYQPSGDDRGSQVFPYVLTTYRLTEHHTAGGMSRWLPYLSELQPEMFCEVSPELAAAVGLDHLGWATIVTARSAIEARVLVTDRMVPVRVHDRIVHQVGLPYHWGRNGITTGDSANDLTHMSLDPDVHIQEVKALTCDIRPGRRPRGPDRRRLIAEYQQQAGLVAATGTAHRTTERHGEPA
ncbi:formate dehydrogenase major subunit [Micromonospora pattaloongensis]|nr:formate dehydrogenase major subunit [Micromonospora pattaloongensis]